MSGGSGGSGRDKIVVKCTTVEVFTTGGDASPRLGAKQDGDPRPCDVLGVGV